MYIQTQTHTDLSSDKQNAKRSILRRVITNMKLVLSRITITCSVLVTMPSSMIIIIIIMCVTIVGVVVGGIVVAMSIMSILIIIIIIHMRIVGFACGIAIFMHHYYMANNCLLKSSSHTYSVRRPNLSHVGGRSKYPTIP